MNNFKIALKIENKRFFRSKKPLMLIVGIILILALNYVLETNIDGEISTNQSILNYYQTFTQFIFIILAIVCGSSISNDVEHHYLYFYKNLGISFNKYVVAKLLVAIIHCSILVLIPFVLIMLNANLAINIIITIISITILITIIILLFQTLLSLFFKRNLYSLISLFVSWLVLSIVNIIPLFKGMISPIDNNSYVHYFISSLLDISSNSVVYQGMLEINNQAYINIFAYLLIIIMILVVSITLVLKIKKNKYK